MPIVFVCPDCASTLRVSDNTAGCKTQCPQCGTALIVPVPSTENTENSFHPSKIPGKQPTAAIPQTLKAPAVWAGVPHSLGEGGRDVLVWGGLGVAFLAVILVAVGAALWVGSRAFNGRDSYHAGSQPPAAPITSGPTTGADTQKESVPINDAMSIAADSPSLPRQVKAAGNQDKTSPAGDAAALKPAEDEPSSHTNNPEKAAPPSPEPMVAERDVLMGRYPEALPEAKQDRLGFWGQRYGVQSGVIKRVGDVDVVLGRKFSTVYVPQNAHNIVEGNMPLFDIPFPVGYRGPEGQFVDPTAGFIPTAVHN